MKKTTTPIHPGEILLKEFLEPLGVTEHRLAVSIGVSPLRINEIVHKKRGISADTALSLAKFFETSDLFWLNLQSLFDLEIKRARPGPVLDASTPFKTS